MADTEDMVQGMYKGTENGFGIGGINGIHHSGTDALGWDNTTVGMASSVFDNLLTQNGIRTNDPNYIGALEPIRAGKFLVKWLKVPAFFSNTATKYLKFFFENAVKSVSGITDSSIAAAGELTFGANGQAMSFPGQLKENNQTVTLNTITCTGDGCGKIKRYWMYGITDPITQVHHMYGKNLRFIRPNYSGTFIYIFMGPTCRPGDIEYACIWNEVWPTSGDGKSKFESGDIGSDNAISEDSIELTGIFQDGPECNILAKYIVAASGLAGQSYFDQMLPAYMYDKFVNNIASNDSDTISSISMAQTDKLTGAQADIYTDDVKKIRSEKIISKYGLDGDNVPSVTNTAQTSINELNEYDSTKFTESNV